MRIWQDLPGQFSCSFLEFSQEGLEEHEAEPKAGDIKGWWAAGSDFWGRRKDIQSGLADLIMLPPPSPAWEMNKEADRASSSKKRTESALKGREAANSTWFFLK